MSGFFAASGAGAGAGPDVDAVFNGSDGAFAFSKRSK
jgi:hypothetical protein